MQTQKYFSVKLEEDALVIEDLKISDESAVQFFSEIEEDQREEVAKSAFRLGVAVLQMSGATSEVDYVNRKFMELEKNIKGLFDEENKQSAISKIDDVISEYFDEDSGSIHTLLDPHVENTPASKLLSSLRSDLESIKDKLGIEEERMKGTQKGFDFQNNEVGPTLAEIARIFGDSLENTSEKEGPLGDVGDFVVTINPKDVLGVESKIVFEAKDAKNYSRKKIIKELEEAKENRGADVGIMVFSEEAASSLRSEISHYQCYRDDKCIVCCLDETRIPFEVAYKRARYLVAKGILEKAGEVDIKQLEGLAGSMERKLKRFSSLKRKITNDKKRLSKSLGESYSGLMNEVRKIEKELSSDVEKFGETLKISSK